MAAFTGTPTSSAQYAAQVATSSTAKRSAAEVTATLRVGYFSYTHLAAAGAGTGEVNLIRLPPGRVRIFSDLSRHVTSQFAVNADLHLGFRAYTEPDGDAVAEDDNAFLDNADVGGGALDAAWVLPAAGSQAFITPLGLIIYAMIDTGNIETDDTIEGWVVWGGVQ